ncbi:glyoxal reductase-like isoform X4 [Rana temporaria]|uniref:glyoxal reductase-like isoform X4 n=1 Tax=Rana temporaria TaxID=8407 RepID=UPI001AADEA1A|nr:glyoxal reductase-like isoform X4 [Rana temporaria]
MFVEGKALHSSSSSLPTRSPSKESKVRDSWNAMVMDMEVPVYPTVPLSNGQKIPVLGLGLSHQGGYSHSALLYALKNCGIRHIDTAKRYGNEEQVGKAIAESGVKREDLWVTTKLWLGDFGYDNAIQACMDSCKRLGLDYLDLYLMHWPDANLPGKSAREARAETWKALEELYDRGVCRSIGVSNFLIHHLEQLKEDCDMAPHLNQNGIITIPKSTKESRILENCQVFDFQLQQNDMDHLSSLHCNRKLIHLTYPLWRG